MSAVREVKYLRELHHPNVIEVRAFACTCAHCSTHSVPLSSRRLVVRSLFSKLLDVFSSKTNLNLVLEFLDTDLEMIIKDRSLVFLPADIKSWMAMTFRGLEFCHRNFILHRVRRCVSSLVASRVAAYHHLYRFLNQLFDSTLCLVFPHRPPMFFFSFARTGLEAEQLTSSFRRPTQAR